MTETVDKLSSESKHWTDVPVGNENAERHAYKLPLRKKVLSLYCSYLRRHWNIN